MFNRNKKNRNSIFSEFNQNPESRRIFFFSFYLIFFLILIIMLRTGNKNNKNVQPVKTGLNYEYKLDRILNGNYHFVFKENLNDVETIYEGDYFDGEYLFLKSGSVSSSYYIKNDLAYVKDNNLLTWNESSNPLLFYSFTKPSNLYKVIRRAKYVSRTEYINDEKLNFTYNISNTNLKKIFAIKDESEENATESDLDNNVEDELFNQIIVAVSENGTVNYISLDLSNYYGYNNQSPKKYIVTFSYSKYDQVEEITSPIN